MNKQIIEIRNYPFHGLWKRKEANVATRSTSEVDILHPQPV
jgi:hypothetical protein